MIETKGVEGGKGRPRSLAAWRELPLVLNQNLGLGIFRQKLGSGKEPSFRFFLGFIGDTAILDKGPLQKSKTRAAQASKFWANSPRHEKFSWQKLSRRLPSGSRPFRTL